MKLYFTCPVRKKIFATEDYSLQQGHRIGTGKEGAKELQGIVILNSTCPYCGKKHNFDVKDIACPLTKDHQNFEK